MANQCGAVTADNRPASLGKTITEVLGVGLDGMLSDFMD